MSTATATLTVETVATFCGLQSTMPGKPFFGRPLELWNLVVPVGGLTVGSTYARETIAAELEAAS